MSKLTDEELLMKVNEKFTLLGMLLDSLFRGTLNQYHCVIIQGDQGLGKSHIIVEKVKEYDRNRPQNADREGMKDIRMITGKTTDYQLFLLLQEHNTPDSVVIFDDCDSAWYTANSLNLLKAATNTVAERRVTWLSRQNDQKGKSDSFIFEGKLVLITNSMLDGVHLKAFKDRAYFFPIQLTTREKMVKIKELATIGIREGMYQPELAVEIVKYIRERIWEFDISKLSMRTFLKLYELAHTFPGDNWKKLAEYTVFGSED